MTDDLCGLSLAEVSDRRAKGQGNNVKLETGRSYWQIIRENFLTFINITFYAISAVMAWLHLYSDAFLVVAVISSGILVNVVQELWAKQQLDKIALLHRPKAKVIRVGQEQEIDPGEIVLGDILVAEAGEQIVVDGLVVGPGKIEVDESLLTGESDLIAKVAGQQVLSGTVCVSGRACYRAERVGKETTAYNLAMSARAFRQVYTPLQVEISLIIRVMMLIACFLWALSGISIFSRFHADDIVALTDFAQRAAVISGLVPVGMYLAITLAYVLGAVRMVGQNVLIQQANAVESLSNVDVLCLDKTGTLTSNHLQIHHLHPVGISEAELRSLLGNYARSLTNSNKTIEAIVHGCQGQAWALVAEFPFTSDRKWSGITIPDGTSYVLGAPEVIGQRLPDYDIYTNLIRSEAAKGLRVLVFGQAESLGEHSPARLLGILVFSDQLRPHVQDTLRGYRAAGVELKIISGDNPDTVTALVNQAGLTQEIKGISGPQLAAMDEYQFRQAVLEHNVFGRISPEQKAQLVQTLRRCGRYVAMIGDGVNDVLSLKQANLGIAMESGSKATRGVADIVLLEDSFGALPFTFLEGQRIRNGIIDVVKLFLVRSLVMMMMIFAGAIVVEHFLFVNKHAAIVALLGVAFPTVFIPLWAKPGLPKWPGLVRNLLHFVVPATLSLACVGLLVYLYFLMETLLKFGNPGDYSIPRTALVTILVFCQLLLVPLLKPPTKFWTGGEPLSGDWRYTWVALGILVFYFLIVVISPVRQFFNLALLSGRDYLFLGLVAIAWVIFLRTLWRTRFFDRFLGVNLG